ncbi:hypothetical protein [Streptomyces sp. NPDC016845]|uniref:hypothetical protein n=1 Tax=Streptomyces sp. NPDC016845 TaxID=3364972 RepID=UPI0037932280
MTSRGLGAAGAVLTTARAATAFVASSAGNAVGYNGRNRKAKWWTENEEPGAAEWALGRARADEGTC